MKLVVPHYYDFGADRALIGSDLVRPDAWDALRSIPGPFALPETRSAWEALADRADLRQRARGIVAVTADRGARSLCSHGVGTAALELNIKRLAPELDLICTDYAPAAVERLRRLFPEADVLLHDLARDDPPHADLHLMHRLDAELSDDAWRRVLARLPEPVLFVPNVVLDLRRALRELARRVLHARRVTRAGSFRNEEALRALWHSSHSDLRVEVGGAPAFLLEPR